MGLIYASRAAWQPAPLCGEPGPRARGVGEAGPEARPTALRRQPLCWRPER